MPTKDRLNSLKAVLPTYFTQSEIDELIVVVDGSSDGTREYLDALSEEQPMLRVLDNGQNMGIPYSKNRGIEAATAELIFLGEDDVELTPDYLQTLLAHKKTSRVDIICARHIFRRENESAQAALARTSTLRGPYVNLKTIAVQTDLRLEQDEIQMMLANPMLGDARIFKAIPFDERYKVNFWREETDFQLSAQEAGYTLGCCPHAVSFNCMINVDRGGAHAAVGLRRTKWVIINNWRFVTKHRTFLRDHFDIGNEYLYISKFAFRVARTELERRLVATKRWMLRQSAV